MTAPPFSPDVNQRLVLDHGDGALLVTGGAGTGKSAVLRERFARLIEGGADPERVALVVGSRRARDATRAALLHRLPASLPELRVVTVHGLAHRVLRERLAVLGYAEPPEVLSAADQFAKVQELLVGQDPAAWPAYGSLLGMRHALELSGTGFEPIVLYVASDTALIAKQTYIAGGGDRPVIEEQFSDYRTVDGVQVAFAAKVLRGGQAVLERRVTDITFNKPIDPALFKRPGP